MNNLEYDIKEWAREKLQQWTMDVEMRCSAVDVSPQVSMAVTVSLMMNLAATLIALTTDADINESGTMFAALIREHRKERPAFQKFLEEEHDL